MPTILIPTTPAARQVSALSLIDRAYSLLGHKAAGEPLSAEDADYGLTALNSLIDSWNTQRLFIVTVEEAIANVSGISATVGPGQTFNVARPVDIENGAFSRVNGIDYSIEWIDRVTYERITLKTVSSSFPQYAYYDQDYPVGHVYFYPVPSASVEVHLPLQVQLTGFSSLSTVIGLLPGYDRALVYSLAEELAPGIRSLDPQIAKTAFLARRAIRHTNVDVPVMNADLRNVRFNIYSGL